MNDAEREVAELRALLNRVTYLLADIIALWSAPGPAPTNRALFSLINRVYRVAKGEIE